jgi:hypothetical protein
LRRFFQSNRLIAADFAQPVQQFTTGPYAARGARLKAHPEAAAVRQFKY